MSLNTVSIDEVAALASTIIEGSTKEDRNLFKTWIYTGQKRLYYGVLDLKTEKVDACELAILKPKDFGKLKDIALFKEDGTEVVYKYQGEGWRIHEDIDYTRYPYSTRVDLSETNDYFHLGSNGDSVCYAMLRYYAVPVDENGQLRIPEDNMLALAFFCKWMWALLKNDNQSEIAERKKDFRNEAARVNAERNLPNMVEGREIARTLNSMIPRVNLNQDQF